MPPRAIHEIPPPDSETIAAVKATCAELVNRPEVLADHFYSHLFRMVPHLREMFPADMSEQTTRMARILVQVVTHLDRPAQIQEYLGKLGRYHHDRWQVGPEDYPCVGRAMVEAIHDLAPTWSSSSSSAWVLVYEWIAASMIAGATTPDPRPTSPGGETGRCPVPARAGNGPAASGA